MQYTTTPGAQGICPGGWHIPTYAEFQTLSTTVGGDGNVLKAIGQGTGTNMSGFSAMLGGIYNYSGGYFIGGDAYFLTSTEYDASNINFLLLFASNNTVYFNTTPKANAFSVRCIKNNPPPNQPSNPSPTDNETNVYTNITLQWSCSDVNGDSLTYNIYFGTDNPPITIVSFNQTDASFIENGLDPGTTYYWKVVARDSHNDSTEGPVWKFTTQTGGGVPCPVASTVPYGGKIYHTVQIGDQCWLRENLDIGTMILGSQNPSNNEIIEKYCYGNDPTNCQTYGGLYQWNEAMQYSKTPGAEGVCPSGWHIPTNAEFQTLNARVGGSSNALKEIGQGTDPGAGINTNGFSALLAGYRAGGGNYSLLTINTHFWGSNEYDSANANIMGFVNTDNVIYLHNYFKDHGFSVRCVKD
jgi:uncharacterized protein (TIGR02145 family)